MTKEEFLFHLKGASFVAMKFAEAYVKNKLTTNFRYDVTLSVSHDNPSLTQFDVYPEDNGVVKKDLTDEEVVDLLYRKGKVPVWIDINIIKTNRKTTTLMLLCAGRYSDDKNEYYYNSNGSGPFGVKSPALPIDYKEGKKFRLRKEV